jgi:hypothetical protein
MLCNAVGSLVEAKQYLVNRVGQEIQYRVVVHHATLVKAHVKDVKKIPVGGGREFKSHCVHVLKKKKRGCSTTKQHEDTMIALHCSFPTAPE